MCQWSSRRRSDSCSSNRYVNHSRPSAPHLLIHDRSSCPKVPNTGAIAFIPGLKLAFYPNGQVRVTSVYNLCAPRSHARPGRDPAPRDAVWIPRSIQLFPTQDFVHPIATFETLNKEIQGPVGEGRRNNP
jgi:hypothetical protein